MQQVQFLRHIADEAAPFAIGDFRKWHAIHQHATGSGTVEAGEHVDDGGFACTRWALQNGNAACGDIEGNVLQDRRFVMGKIDMLEAAALFQRGGFFARVRFSGGFGILDQFAGAPIGGFQFQGALQVVLRAREG